MGQSGEWLARCGSSANAVHGVPGLTGISSPKSGSFFWTIQILFRPDEVDLLHLTLDILVSKMPV